MPLDTEIKGDPAALRATGTWLRRTSGAADQASAELQRTRTQSQPGWDGTAASGYRYVMTNFGTRIDGVSTGLGRTGKALDEHAGDLDDCRAAMKRARDIATSAGLRVDGYTVHDPGPPPPRTGLAGAQGPYEPDSPMGRANAAYNKELGAYASKVRAYTDAALIVSACRKKETASQSTLMQFLQGFNDTTPFNVANLGIGYTGGLIARSKRFVKLAEAWEEKALEGAKLLDEDLPPVTARSVIIRKGLADIEANRYRQLSQDNKILTALEHAPGGKWVLDGDRIPRSLTEVPGLGKVGLASKGIPVAGWLVTGVAIGNDVRHGKQPVKSAASEIGGTVAGAAVTGAVDGAITGPEGAVLGGLAGVIVGAGVAFGIDEWGGTVASKLAESGSGLLHGAADGVKELSWPRFR
ncbi:WXG100 family type VII secretion target [Actinomadura napierensis]|uniref:WXG100 family type VII secretion target n=1 Tax=Actinomadura napierensis TaxID=267854 RepID=A0ABN3ACY4_9ACTN